MSWILILIILAAVIYFANTQSKESRSPKRDVLVPIGSPRQDQIGNIQGPGAFEFDVVGESHYQRELESIAGAKDEETKEYECVAELVLDDGNQYDNQAVIVAINGKTVGHLSRQHAREFRTELRRQGLNISICRVPAMIVGGWKRKSDVGSFGVKLDLPFAD